MLVKRITVLIVSVLLFEVASVAQQQITVATVEVTPSQTEAEIGQEVKLTVVAKDASGKVVNEKPSTYFAGPFDAAVADDNGVVKLVGPGEVVVGAIVAGKTGLAKIIVKPVGVKTVAIDPIAAPIAVGSTVQLEAMPRNSAGDPTTNIPIIWTSNNSAIATVDAAGAVTGVAPGKVAITATAGAATASTTINVVRNTLRSLRIEPATASARTGDVIRFKAQGTPGDQFATRWSVSGHGARVYPDGAFVAEQPGTYIVSAGVGNVFATASIVVTARNAERKLQVVGRATFRDVQGAEVWLIGNYAYYSTIADKFFVYDVTDPAHPKLTDTVKVDARIINDISTTPDGKILVISREGASSRKNGIAFYDTSDPAHPKLISEYTATVTGGVHSAFVDGHYVYLTDDATGSMRVIDFRDVKNPKEVGRWQTEPQHTKFIRTKEAETTAGRYLHDLQVKDGLAYLAYWRDGLVILDVGAGINGGSPENPKLVSQLRFNHYELYGDGWLAGTHSVFRYKNYVFVGDEVFPSIFDIHSRARVPVRGTTHIVDVSDINNPRKVAEYEVPEGGAHNMWVEDDIMYMGYYSGGARVVDVRPRVAVHRRVAADDDDAPRARVGVTLEHGPRPVLAGAIARRVSPATYPGVPIRGDAAFRDRR